MSFFLWAVHGSDPDFCTPAILSWRRERKAPGHTETLCLARLVTGDAEARAKVHAHPCITVDGCPKLCARKNVELAGGRVAHGVRVFDTPKRHRGAQFGSPTSLTGDGWSATDEIAAEIGQAAQQLLTAGNEELNHG
jgi:hypothetical protein